MCFVTRPTVSKLWNKHKAPQPVDWPQLYLSLINGLTAGTGLLPASSPIQYHKDLSISSSHHCCTLLATHDNNHQQQNNHLHYQLFTSIHSYAIHSIHYSNHSFSLHIQEHLYLCTIHWSTQLKRHCCICVLLTNWRQRTSAAMPCMQP